MKTDYGQAKPFYAPECQRRGQLKDRGTTLGRDLVSTLRFRVAQIIIDQIEVVCAE